MLNRLAKFFNSKQEVHFFVTEELDYLIFRNIMKHLKNIKLVSKNKKIKQLLKERYQEKSILYPTFPDAVVTARHCLHYYPDNIIIKIGLRHGPYHFKNFISAKKYNKFDLFLLTSETEVAEAMEIGINKAQCGGFPKSDSLFNQSPIDLQKFKNELFNNDKPTVLFSSTWNESGVSGVHFWYNQLNELTNEYNILVTLHPWVSKEFSDVIRKCKDVKLIDLVDLSRYMLISDVLISDTSSIIAEYSLLDKPIITFKIPAQGRLPESIVNMLDEATIRIEDFSQLNNAINSAIRNPNELSIHRKKNLKIMFADGLGEHGLLAANKINTFLVSLGFLNLLKN